MNKVWLLTRGEHSDFRILGVFSTKENALKYSSLLEDCWEPEEVILDELMDEIEGEKNWFINMNEDGRVTHFRFRPHTLERSFITYLGSSPEKNWCHWSGLATSKEHAIKICNEKRVQAIALGNWGKT